MVDASGDEPSPEPAAKICADLLPHSARVWNYWMGGKDNYEVDRQAGNAWSAINPGIVDDAKQSRQFIIRVVRYLAAEAGIRQFLDIGTGLPTMQNTHEVAQAIAPESRIVYVDNDPLVLAYARALLTNTTPEGVTTYLDADVRQPDQIISDAHNVLNFTQPVAIMLMGILGHVPDYTQARGIVATLMNAAPPGSYLALYDGVQEGDAKAEAEAAYAGTGAVAYHNRDPEEIARFFGGLDLVAPGVVSISQWRPDPATRATVTPVGCSGGVARTS